MTKKFKIHLIKTKRSYSAVQISELLNVHIRTVQSWKKQGLNIVEGTYHPYLVMGEDLKVFLINQSKKRKTTLNSDEFYCLSCKKPVKAQFIQNQNNHRRIGKNKISVTIQGICETCGKKVNRFSSMPINDDFKESV